MLRVEDEALLTGKGRYVADRRPDGMLTMVVLRATSAHGAIRRLDAAAARGMPGVHLVLTAADLAGLGVGPLKLAAETVNRDGSPMVVRDRPILAGEAVKYVGQPVAAIIAETEDQALDALEAIELDIDELPAAVDIEAGALSDAPKVWPELPDNRSFDWEIGNRAETEKFFAEAAHVVELTVRHPRIVIAPLETRGALGVYDSATGRYTLTTPSQGVVAIRGAMADCVGVATDMVRVITEDVGGSFAVKIWPYPEQVLALVAAKATGRPVHWMSSRTEGMVSDIMGRGRVDRAALALDKDYKFLAFRIDALADMGAFINHVAANTSTKGAVRVFGHCYRIPGLYYRVQGLFTNLVPTDAYRGAGKPESVSTTERLIDLAADRLGIDRIELRRRNLVTPADLPYRTAMGETYDGGDFPAILERILAAGDIAGFPARRADSEAQGLKRGLGLTFHLHATGGSVAERSEVIAQPDGTVIVRSGTQDSGQGHRTALALVAAEALEIPVERIRVEQGDSDYLTKGGGTGGSNLMPIAANTVHRTALQLIQQARAVAGHLLEASARDIEYGFGEFRIAGTDRKIALGEVAAGWNNLPEAAREAEMGAGCVAQLDFEGLHTTFPNGAYAVEVEVDPQTGRVKIQRWTGIDDLGRIINEATAQGQIQGGIGQSVGEALLEAVRYDPQSGQLLSGSFMDYTMPRADDMPSFNLSWAPTPSPNSLIGAKGVGEVSSIGGPGPIMNAVLDALRPLGVQHVDIPMTPETVWRAVRQAR
ncbi:MAG: xanthine dehydrogenase family protein molybdopterin-binding subunit [Alphaproteobacteria bacterium]|nr:xanthine dehydrogenase family protein molybdopterin-binding subunit [Alphaproteobacteria bacterium]MBU0796062.1 xanthine dehydrogenase family protein molybdopterin-binding subunit [Alphaproteobacteria bacterium]MBU0886636.1 xanthine dehydrogenase family protein molybdopterin-binding subunit [Alphaproteobacteria bacterium]MBU1814490.1 xanthine dehydrogenase family protein molybdopterin-binding subunit [Alphaproteobacteria bacterium]